MQIVETHFFPSPNEISGRDVSDYYEDQDFSRNIKDKNTTFKVCISRFSSSKA